MGFVLDKLQVVGIEVVGIEVVGIDAVGMVVVMLQVLGEAEEVLHGMVEDRLKVVGLVEDRKLLGEDEVKYSLQVAYKAEVRFLEVGSKVSEVLEGFRSPASRG